MRRFWGGRGGAGGDNSKKPKKGVYSSRINSLFFGQRGNHHHHHSEDPYEEIHLPTGLSYTRKPPSFTYPNDLCSSARCTYRRPSSIPPLSEIFGSDSHHHRSLHLSSKTQNFLSSSCENGNGRNRSGRNNTTAISARQESLRAAMADPGRNQPSPPLSISTVYQTKHTPSPVCAGSDPPGSPLELPSSASSLLSKEVEKFMQQRPLPPVPCHPFFAPPLPVKQKSLPRSVKGNQKVVVERKKSGGGRSAAAAYVSEVPADAISVAADAATPPPCSPTTTVISVTRKTTATARTVQEPRILTMEVLEYIGENLDQCGAFRNTYNRSEYPLPNSENAKLVIVDLRCDRTFFEEVLVAAFHLKDLLSEVERDGVLFLGYIRSTDFFNQSKVFILENSGCLYLYREKAFFKVANTVGELAKHGLLDVVVYTNTCALTDSDVSTLLHDEGIRKAVKNWVFACEQKMITSAACGEAAAAGMAGRGDVRAKNRGSGACYRERHRTETRNETRNFSNLRVLNEAEYKTRFLYGPLVSQSNTRDMRSVTPMYLSGFISYVIKDLKRRAQNEKAWNETQNVGKAAEEMYEKIREHLLAEIKKSLPELNLDMLKRQLDSLTGECRCDHRVSTPYQHLRHVLSTLAYVVYWTCYSNGGSCMSYAVYLSVRSMIALERLVFAELTWSRLKTAKKTSRGERPSRHSGKHASLRTPPSYTPPVPEFCRTSSSKSKKLSKTAPCQFNVSAAMATLELTDDENRTSQGNNDHNEEESYYEDIEQYVCVLNNSYEI
ncbi:protein E32 [Elephant endotheliotropic herpesvirus 2]|nr:protein E32 [Elephant endotheliotropic herpesvirus 2]